MTMTLELMGIKSKRRDKLVIMTEIIEIANKGSSKTHIMFKANLSFSQLSEYIGFLLNYNLLSKVEDTGKTVYKSTERGLDFMERQKQIIDMFNEKYCRSVAISKLKCNWR